MRRWIRALRERWPLVWKSTLLRERDDWRRREQRYERRLRDAQREAVHWRNEFMEATNVISVRHLHLYSVSASITPDMMEPLLIFELRLDQQMAYMKLIARSLTITDVEKAAHMLAENLWEHARHHTRLQIKRAAEEFLTKGWCASGTQ